MYRKKEKESRVRRICSRWVVLNRIERTLVRR